MRKAAVLISLEDLSPAVVGVAVAEVMLIVIYIRSPIKNPVIALESVMPERFPPCVIYHRGRALSLTCIDILPSTVGTLDLTRVYSTLLRPQKQLISPLAMLRGTVFICAAIDNSRIGRRQIIRPTTRPALVLVARLL